MSAPEEDRPGSQSTDLGRASPPPRPRWLKVSAIVVALIVLAVLVIALMGGEHGPGRHLQGSGSRGHGSGVSSVS